MYHNNKKYLKAFLLVFSLIILSFSSNGQNIQVIMESPESVAADERFQLNITVNAKPSAYLPPNLNDFDILMGPSTSTSSSIQIVNGKMSQNFEYTYSYILQPKKPGKINVSPAEFTVDGKKHKSNPLIINVYGSASQAQSSPGSGQSNSPAQPVDESNELFIKVFLDKTNVYQGEFIIATIKLYSRVNISAISRLDFPSFDGFYKQDIETPPLRRLDREMVNGQPYGTGILKKFVLIPQKTGEQAIAPCVMECAVEVQTRSNSFFRRFFLQPLSNRSEKSIKQAS